MINDIERAIRTFNKGRTEERAMINGKEGCKIINVEMELIITGEKKKEREE